MIRGPLSLSLVMCIMGCDDTRDSTSDETGIGVDGGADSGAVDDGGGANDSGDGGEAPTPVPDLNSWATEDALMVHLDALQAIADANGSTRAVGGNGYLESVNYAVQVLEDAGYTDVQRQVFQVNSFHVVGTPTLDATSPDAQPFGYGADFVVMDSSASGAGEALIVAVDVQLPPGDEPNSSTSGCELDDYVGFPVGAVALVQRGTCTFANKVERAQDAGAVAILIFNEGQAGRTDPVQGSLGGAPDIPVLGLSFAAGEDLVGIADASGTVSFNVETSREPTDVWNVLADSSFGDPDQVIVVGGHLDSVTAGPGINDNGTGTAAVLTMAQAMAERAALSEPDALPAAKVRFALWGAEEVGLLGSVHYVADLSDDDHARIAANINLDMIGSPNGAVFVYDGDGSMGEAGPDGSAWIEDRYRQRFVEMGVPMRETPFDGRSDYGPFIWTGLPAGGVFSGAETPNDGADAEYWGTEPGVPYDACYHRSCDDLSNLHKPLMVAMADASAMVLQELADDPSVLAAPDGPPMGADRRAALAAGLARASEPGPSGHNSLPLLR